MPFYEYASTSDTPCSHCTSGFTVLQKISDPVVSECPECGRPVRRLISPPNVVSGQAHRLRESNIEKAGFTQYKKAGNGVYEKTVGKGPDTIKGN